MKYLNSNLALHEILPPYRYQMDASWVFPVCFIYSTIFIQINTTVKMVMKKILDGRRPTIRLFYIFIFGTLCYWLGLVSVTKRNVQNLSPYTLGINASKEMQSWCINKLTTHGHTIKATNFALITFYKR